MFPSARRSSTGRAAALKSPTARSPPHKGTNATIGDNVSRSSLPVIFGAAAMASIVRGGLIQATLCEPATSPVEKIKQAMIEKHEALIAQAAGRGAQFICLQELFYG